MNEGCNFFFFACMVFLVWTLSKFKSGTVHVAQVEVSVNQRGSVVEVLGHVIQPVRLHSSDTLVVVLDPQRHLDCVVLHLAFSDRRVVVQSQQIHTCRTRTENKTSSSAQYELEILLSLTLFHLAATQSVICLPQRGGVQLQSYPERLGKRLARRQTSSGPKRVNQSDSVLMQIRISNLQWKKWSPFTLELFLFPENLQHQHNCNPLGVASYKIKTRGSQPKYEPASRPRKVGLGVLDRQPNAANNSL